MRLPDEYYPGGYRLEDYEKTLMANSHMEDGLLPQLKKDYFDRITRGVECPCGKK